MANLTITNDYLKSRININVGDYGTAKGFTNILSDSVRGNREFVVLADGKSIMLYLNDKQGNVILSPTANPGPMYDYLVDSINGVSITSQSQLYDLLWACRYPQFSIYHNANLSNSYVVVKSSACIVSSINFINPAGLTLLNLSQPAYLKMYNGSSAPAISTAPIYSLGAGSLDKNSMFFNKGSELYFPDGLCVAAVGGSADNSTSAPASACNINIQYL